MNNGSVFEDLLYNLLLSIINLFLMIKEIIYPTPSKLTDFLPMEDPKYEGGCFYLKFPCRKFQVQRTQAVLNFWGKVYYVNHGDKFVYVEKKYDETPWSFLTIRFRPKLSSEIPSIYVFYDSEVHFNQINKFQLTQIERLAQYIQTNNELESVEKEEYLQALNDMISERIPDNNSLEKLFKFITKHKESIGTVADIIGIISFIANFFK